MLRRLDAVKRYRRPGSARRAAGGLVLAALLAGGALTAYAAAPAKPAGPQTAATPGNPAARAAERGVAPAPQVQPARPGAPAPPAPGVLPAAAGSASAPRVYQFTPSLPAGLALSVFADEGELAQVRAEMLQMHTAQERAATPASPTLTGPLSVYAPPGASAAAVIALAFQDPRGTWEASEPDAQGGRTFTRTSLVPYELDPRMRRPDAHIVTFIRPLAPPDSAMAPAQAAAP